MQGIRIHHTRRTDDDVSHTRLLELPDHRRLGSAIIVASLRRHRGKPAIIHSVARRDDGGFEDQQIPRHPRYETADGRTTHPRLKRPQLDWLTYEQVIL